MPELNVSLDSLDGVDESLTDYYTQADDGNYYLSVKGVDGHPAVRALATTLKKYKEAAPSAHGLKQKLEKLSALEPFEGLEMDADEVRERMQRLDELEASGGDVDGKIAELRAGYEKQRDQLAATHKKDIEGREKEVKRLQSFVERLTVDNEIDRALDKVKVIPETREAVKALLHQRGPRVIQDGDDYRGVYESDLGEELAIADYVEAWSKKDEAAPFMPASGNKGSGAGGGSSNTGANGANPWQDDQKNVTKQMEIASKNPALARQLAAQAGKQAPL